MSKIDGQRPPLYHRPLATKQSLTWQVKVSKRHLHSLMGLLLPVRPQHQKAQPLLLQDQPWKSANLLSFKHKKQLSLQLQWLKLRSLIDSFLQSGDSTLYVHTHRKIYKIYQPLKSKSIIDSYSEIYRYNMVNF